MSQEILPKCTINKWYKKVFKHFGWMAMPCPSSKIHESKQQLYLLELEELMKNIKARHEASFVGECEKHDLAFMYNKVQLLKTLAEQTFAIKIAVSKTGGKRKGSKKKEW